MTTLLKWILLLCTVPVALVIPHVHTLAGDSAESADDRLSENQPITLSVQNEPLGQVLETIGSETGFVFSIDVQWKSHPVSVTLNKTPLHKGLKRILADLNNVIIYDSDNKVKIIILGKIEQGQRPSLPGKSPPYRPTPVYQQPGPTEEPQAEEPEAPPEPEPDADTAEEEPAEADTAATEEEKQVEEAEPDAVEGEGPADSAPEETEKPSDEASDAENTPENQAEGQPPE